LHAIQVSADLFQNLGFMLNCKKSVLIPTQSIEYLGFTIDSIAMTVTPTTEKLDKLHVLVSKLLKKQSTTIRHMAQVIGGLMATHPGNPWAPLFTKQMEIEKLKALTASHWNFEAIMPVSHYIKEDLKVKRALPW
jgi:hypothetical protein